MVRAAGQKFFEDTTVSDREFGIGDYQGFGLFATKAVLARL